MERGKASPIIALVALAVSIVAIMPLQADPMAGDSAEPVGIFIAESKVDWTSGLIQTHVEMNLGAAGILLPSGRTQAELGLKSAVPDLVRAYILAVGLDSYRTIGDSLLDGSLDASAFEAFLESGKRIRSSLSRDLGRLTASYEWRLADLSALYVRHTRPVDMPLAERYTPTKAYTGIVVFIKGEHRVRGEQRSSVISPCLFPRIYDESMHTIVERNLLEPEYLRSWGALAYATGIDDPIVAYRAGEEPLRIMASSIFGSRRTDAVISTEDALKILGSPENKEMIRQGRIVFIIDQP